jgi:Protein of unknown function, DUF547
MNASAAKIITALWLLLSAAVTLAGSAEDFDYILQKYVKGDYFDYAALVKNPADRQRLQGFMDWQASADISSLPREDQIAFYINAYNSANIKAIVDHYPVHTPTDIPGYFDKLKFKVAGEELTISQIEYERLIARYKDMRAHFAVVCSDRGCMPLRGVAWKGKTLHADLETVCKQFVHDERQFKIDYDKKEVWISKLFEWYGKKFTQDPDRPVAKPELFILPYVDDKAKTLLASGDYTLRIIEWNWTLNEKVER